jgi:coenzyme F420 hydrogenase subunit beta
MEVEMGGAVETMPATNGLDELRRQVIEAGLCVYCGACLDHCPYLRRYKGRVVVMDSCDLCEARCYQYCPRTPIDFEALSEKVFGEPYTPDGLGTVKEVFLARSKSSQIHRQAQDGGAATTLLTVALEEGLIDAAVLTRMSDDKTPGGFVARTGEEILQCAGNSYEATFSLEALNRLPAENQETLGVVGLPCQLEALGKMRVDAPNSNSKAADVTLTLGLFCGWACLPFKFHEFLRGKVDLRQVVKFDIPHHPDDSFDVYTTSDVRSIKLDEIRRFINPACDYCTDMTASFADISLGSGRRNFGWNTVIIRSERGKDLWERAMARGMLEASPVPEENLANLERACMNKKRGAVERIVEKSGNSDDLLYLNGSERQKKGFLSLLP